MTTRILALISLISLSGLALADTATTGGARVIENPTSDGNLILRINDGGVKTDALTITGSTSVMSLAQPLPVASGGTAGTTQAAARTGLGLGSLSTLSTISTSEITNDTIAAVDIGADAVGESELNNTSGNIPWACGIRRVHTGAGVYTDLEQGDCVASFARNNTGDHTMVMNLWTSTPVCSVTPERNAGDSILCSMVSTTSSTNLRVNCFVSTTGAPIDTTFNATCIGFR